ncbi:MAG: hypothetical protein ACM3UZ_04495 [Acidobacteriota bacterium]
MNKRFLMAVALAVMSVLLITGVVYSAGTSTTSATPKTVTVAAPDRWLYTTYVYDAVYYRLNGRDCSWTSMWDQYNALGYMGFELIAVTPVNDTSGTKEIHYVFRSRRK